MFHILLNWLITVNHVGIFLCTDDILNINIFYVRNYIDCIIFSCCCMSSVHKYWCFASNFAICREQITGIQYRLPDTRRKKPTQQYWHVLPVANYKPTVRTDHITSMIVFHKHSIGVIWTCQRSNFDTSRPTCFTEYRPKYVINQ